MRRATWQQIIAILVWEGVAFTQVHPRKEAVLGELAHYNIDPSTVSWVTKDVRISNVLDLTNPWRFENNLAYPWTTSPETATYILRLWATYCDHEDTMEFSFPPLEPV